MMVQNINGINPINNVQNSRRTNGMERTSITDTSDSINVSDEAKEAARAYFLSQVAEETPDVRSDLVASVKEKIKDPNYLNSVTIGSAADRILDSWGF
ncbi:MAG: flagellar biosynthesis anti-sigma factor FlgM [Spirochaetales bacterium]|jgi:negative regulator of flagellin synthesis FlgM|uniref:Negative regulator of flagellin synthesis FlgM n=1 Tax=Treponema berlinense TaxID=225004 RepID=A0A1T4N0S0_9SPIR|nr:MULTISPECIES: flagellar biosynthesis anti-sigma factor FlgM [Treponema]MDO5766063.1 flagellar biosynthesis anti-sigma factor FlgM [Spirochaetales bacterium]MBQ9102881.1 flagellar biosynthesis anti-sigma factor FlgM [Treponema sp.]MCI5540840.1 flagellar biosynthesis anti-sigma factor FlgM [Treponema berlinense]MDD5834596.1 flagellar biosynthesis anti-sigma factor FlgM [Treponema berlinense]SJZ72889.1 negative regulator of flagellin synthesis FlgM [Treponema berlinense]